VPERVKPSFVIFDIRALAQPWASECSDITWFWRGLHNKLWWKMLTYLLTYCKI